MPSLSRAIISTISLVPGAIFTGDPFSRRLRLISPTPSFGLPLTRSLPLKNLVYEI